MYFIAQNVKQWNDQLKKVGKARAMKAGCSTAGLHSYKYDFCV